MTPLQRDSAALRPDETSVLLPVRGGLHTLVDRDIAEKVNGARLCIGCHGRRWARGYVTLPKRFGRVHLHEFVLGRRPPLVIDHRSGNPLDNRRRNLRHVTRAVNVLNRRRRPRWGWRGVYPSFGRWTARPAKKRTGTTHSVALLAAIERDEFVWRRHHVRDVLNFPQFVKRRHVRGFLEATRGRIFRVWFVKRATGHLRVMTCRTVDPKLALPAGTPEQPGLFDGGPQAGDGRPQAGEGSPQAVDPCRLQPPASGLRFDPSERDLVAVFDMARRGYRFLPVEGVLAVAFRGQRYRIVR